MLQPGRAAHGGVEHAPAARSDQFTQMEGSYLPERANLLSESQRTYEALSAAWAEHWQGVVCVCRLAGSQAGVIESHSGPEDGFTIAIPPAFVRGILRGWRAEDNLPQYPGDYVTLFSGHWPLEHRRFHFMAGQRPWSEVLRELRIVTFSWHR